MSISQRYKKKKIGKIIFLGCISLRREHITQKLRNTQDRFYKKSKKYFMRRYAHATFFFILNKL